MKLFLTLLITSLFLFSAPLHAQGVATFSYQRGEITILREKPPLLPPLPWSDGSQQPQTESRDKHITVDIRASDALYKQQGWIDLSGLANLQGMLFIFDKPTSAHIPKILIYAPLDVVWIDAEGKITSIAPNLVLANLNEPIFGTTLSKAILLLAGGTSQQHFIAPGDRVVSEEFFTPPPNILVAPK